MTDLSTPRPGVKRFIGIDWDFGSLRTAGNTYWSWVALLATLMALGALSWFMLFTRGGEVLSMRDGSPWGLWFTNYMFYVGLSAGGLVVYASVHLFGADHFAPLSRLAVLQAGVLTMLAALGILTDMERPWRAVWMLLTPNPSAPFIYTGSAVGLYTILCFIDLWVLITGKGGHKLAFTMTLIALPAAIYLHTTTAFVLAMNKSRELWHTAVMVPIFLTSATASGIALLIIFAYILQATGRMKFKPSMFRSLSTLLATVMIIDLFLLCVEILMVFWPTSAEPGHTTRLIEFLTGRLAFSLLPVLILGFTAFGLLARRKTRHLPQVQLAASILYVVAVFFKRYALMAMGFSFTPLGQKAPVYFPSMVETFLALGILAFGLLFVTVAVKVLPIEVPEEEHSHAEVPTVASEPAVSRTPALEPAAEPVMEQALEPGVSS